MKCPKCGYEIPEYDDDDEEEKSDHYHVPGRVCMKCHPSAGLITFPTIPNFSS